MMANVFKTEECRDMIRSRYNQILSNFPFKQLYVETSFGKTFVLESGDPKNPPLILLHGSCSNSAFWSGEISVLLIANAEIHVLETTGHVVLNSLEYVIPFLAKGD